MKRVRPRLQNELILYSDLELQGPMVSPDGILRVHAKQLARFHLYSFFEPCMVRKLSQMRESNQVSFKMLGVLESEVFENRTNVIQMADSRSQIPRSVQVAEA